MLGTQETWWLKEQAHEVVWLDWITSIECPQSNLLAKGINYKRFHVEFLHNVLQMGLPGGEVQHCQPACTVKK